MSILLSLLLAGCATDSSAALLSTFADDLSSLRSTVDDHAATVQACTDLGQVAALETSYAQDWGTGMDAMQQAMDDLAGCDMGSGEMGMMDDARTMCDDMTSAVSAHGTEQDAADSLDTCFTNEDDHVQAMHDWMDQLGVDHDGWQGSGMQCHMSGGMGM